MPPAYSGTTTATSGNLQLDVRPELAHPEAVEPAAPPEAVEHARSVGGACGSCAEPPAKVHRTLQPPSAAGDAALERARRTEASDERAQAELWASRTFGQDWRRVVHSSHQLWAAPPLLYCRRCGRHAPNRQHLAALKGFCKGEPATSDPYKSRRKCILDGKHPVSKVSLQKAVPLAKTAAPPSVGGDASRAVRRGVEATQAESSSVA